MEAINIVSTFPVIDLPATGANILRLRQTKGFSVRDLQQYFGFEEPQAIYKWQRGQSLPSVDNLYALSKLLDVPMNDILITKNDGQQAEACCPAFYAERVRWAWRDIRAVLALIRPVRSDPAETPDHNPVRATCFHRCGPFHRVGEA